MNKEAVDCSVQQNGVAEKANRTLVEMARTMLIHSNLAESFWAEAVRTASYIRNRTTTKFLRSKTPFEVLHGYKPTVGHFKIFGSKAIVLNKNKSPGKFAPKGIECIMIGYSEESKAYRLYNPKNGKIIVGRDVVFFENTFNEHSDVSSEPSALIFGYGGANLGESSDCQERNIDFQEGEDEFIRTQMVPEAISQEGENEEMKKKYFTRKVNQLKVPNLKET